MMALKITVDVNELLALNKLYGAMAELGVFQLKGRQGFGERNKPLFTVMTIVQKGLTQQTRFAQNQRVTKIFKTGP